MYISAAQKCLLILNCKPLFFYLFKCILNLIPTEPTTATTKCICIYQSAIPSPSLSISQILSYLYFTVLLRRHLTCHVLLISSSRINYIFLGVPITMHIILYIIHLMISTNSSWLPKYNKETNNSTLFPQLSR